MVDRRARLRFEADDAGLNRALTRIERNTGAIDKKIGNLGRSFGKLRTSINAAGLLIAARQMVRLGKEAFDLGSAVEETASKFNTVFGESAAEVDRFIATFGRMAGLTETEGRDIAATAGSIAQGFGLAEAASAGFAQSVVKLAGDFASFQNRDIEETFRAIKSAVVGQFEPLDNLGVVIRKVDVETKALEQTSKSAASALTQQELVTATLALITERMGVQLGDLARTQDSSANRARQAARDFRQLRDDLAVVATDALEPLLDLIAELGDSLNQNRPVVIAWAKVVTQSLAAIIAITDSAFNRFRVLAKMGIGVASTINPLEKMRIIFESGQSFFGTFTQDAEAIAAVANRISDALNGVVEESTSASSALKSAIGTTGASDTILTPLVRDSKLLIDDFGTLVRLKDRLGKTPVFSRFGVTFAGADTLAASLGAGVGVRTSPEAPQQLDLDPATPRLIDAVVESTDKLRVNLEQFGQAADQLAIQLATDLIRGVRSFQDALVSLVQGLLNSLSQSLEGGQSLFGALGSAIGGAVSGSVGGGTGTDAGGNFSVAPAGPALSPAPTSASGRPQDAGEVHLTQNFNIAAMDEAGVEAFFRRNRNLLAEQTMAALKTAGR